MAKSEDERKSLDFQDFFSAAEARIDRWRELTAFGRAWEAAVARGQTATTAHAERHAPAGRGRGARGLLGLSRARA